MAGTPNAALAGMKPILLVAVLALGPALAEQFPPPPQTAAAAADTLAARSGTAPLPPPTEAERRALCGS